jgi:hypothetical protein
MFNKIRHVMLAAALATTSLAAFKPQTAQASCAQPFYKRNGWAHYDNCHSFDLFVRVQYSMGFYEYTCIPAHTTRTLGVAGEVRWAEWASEGMCADPVAAPEQEDTAAAEDEVSIDG